MGGGEGGFGALCCAVCAEALSATVEAKQPRLLPCGHSFCLACLQAHEGRAGALTCPVCCAPCADKAADLKKNFQLMDVIESLTAKPEVKRVEIPCTGCDAPAISFCSACPGQPAFCQQCFSSLHAALAKLASHVPTALEEKSSYLCSEHDQKLVLFCRTCKRVACPVCGQYGEHKGHTCVLIPEAATEIRKTIESSQTWLEGRKEAAVQQLVKLRQEEQDTQLRIVQAQSALEKLRTILREENDNILVSHWCDIKELHDFVSNSLLDKQPDLKHHLVQALKPRRLSELVFSCSAPHADNAAMFYQASSRAKHTLILVEAKSGRITGGFASVAWPAVATDAYIADTSSFLLLSDPPLFKTAVTTSTARALVALVNGPAFGTGYDIVFDLQLFRVTSRFGHAYKDSKSFGPFNEEISKVEVFSVE